MPHVMIIISLVEMWSVTVLVGALDNLFTTTVTTDSIWCGSKVRINIEPCWCKVIVHMLLSCQLQVYMYTLYMYFLHCVWIPY